MLIQLVYESKVQGDFTEDDLSQLLAYARKRNAQEDITGLLIFHGGYFLQILEGPEENVMNCFKRIKNDDRHDDIWMLARLNMKERGFSRWSMGLSKTQDMPDELQESMRDLLGVRTRMQEIYQADPDGEAAYTAKLVQNFLRQFQSKVAA